jgi:hypothetical protein
MALAVRQRVDLGGQNNAFGQNADDNVTDVEMTSYLNASVCELFGLLVSAYGDNYYWAPDYFLPIVSGTYVYALPQDFYKLVNVDLGLDSSGITWRSIRPYNIHQRNQSPGFVGGGQQYLGWINLSYQLQGQNISFLPNTGNIPGPIRLQYIPEPPLLCATLPTAYATSTAYAQGAQVTVTLTPATGNATQQVFTALSAGTSGGTAPSWNVPGTTQDNSILWTYSCPLSLCATTFDGIAGWEDYVILDSAIKCAVKQEMDVSALLAQRQAMLMRIDAEKSNRQAGDPEVVTGGYGWDGGVGSDSGWGVGGGSW